MCGRLVNLDTVARVLADYYHLKTDTQLAALNEALSRVPAETVGKELFGNSEQLNDTISRVVAIDALDEQIRQCDKALSAFDISMKDEYAVKVERASLVAFRETLEYMSSAQPGWIPVTERLPRPNEEDGNGFYKAYLVQDGRWMDAARWDGKYWIAWGYSTVLLNVVAWMSLPKPWKGEQE